MSASFSIIESTRWQEASTPVYPEDIDAEWARRAVTTRGGWIRVERYWNPHALVSTAPAIDALNELAESLVSDATVLEVLAANGTLDGGTLPRVQPWATLLATFLRARAAKIGKAAQRSDRRRIPII